MSKRPRPAGWYPDPRGRAPERYWDGRAWTTRVRREVESGEASATPSAEVAPAAPAPVTPPRATPPRATSARATKPRAASDPRPTRVPDPPRPQLRPHQAEIDEAPTGDVDEPPAPAPDDAGTPPPDAAPIASRITVIGAIGIFVGAAGLVGAIAWPTGAPTYLAAGLTVLLGLFAGGGGATRGPVAALVLLGVLDALLGGSLAYLARF